MIKILKNVIKKLNEIANMNNNESNMAHTDKAKYNVYKLT